MHVCVSLCMYMCVCVCERERDGETVCVCACVCVCVTCVCVTLLARCSLTEQGVLLNQWYPKDWLPEPCSHIVGTTMFQDIDSHLVYPFLGCGF